MQSNVEEGGSPKHSKGDVRGKIEVEESKTIPNVQSCCTNLRTTQKLGKRKRGLGLERAKKRVRGGLRRKQASRKRQQQEEASGGQGQRIDFTGERASSRLGILLCR